MLEPADRLLAAIVRQAIRDLHTGPKCEREAAQAYLGQLGLLNSAGEVIGPECADMGLLWPTMK